MQHALRAFTAVDRKVIKQTAENYPESFYKTEDLITQMGIGEALVTMLNEKGIPTPLAHVMLLPLKQDGYINSIGNRWHSGQKQTGAQIQYPNRQRKRL